MKIFTLPQFFVHRASRAIHAQPQWNFVCLQRSSVFVAAAKIMRCVKLLFYSFISKALRFSISSRTNRVDIISNGKYRRRWLQRPPVADWKERTHFDSGLSAIVDNFYCCARVRLDTQNEMNWIRVFGHTRTDFSALITARQLPIAWTQMNTYKKIF